MSPILVGADEVSKIYVGSTALSKVYVGLDEVWSLPTIDLPALPTGEYWGRTLGLDQATGHFLLMRGTRGATTETTHYFTAITIIRLDATGNIVSEVAVSGTAITVGSNGVRINSAAIAGYGDYIYITSDTGASHDALYAVTPEGVSERIWLELENGSNILTDGANGVAADADGGYARRSGANFIYSFPHTHTAPSDNRAIATLTSMSVVTGQDDFSVIGEEYIRVFDKVSQGATVAEVLNRVDSSSIVTIPRASQNPFPIGGCGVGLRILVLDSTAEKIFAYNRDGSITTD